MTLQTDWPYVPSAGWPVHDVPVDFELSGRPHQGMLHHASAKTVWVRYRGQLIKRHRRKHQVRY